jgi:hypothetical protein
MHPGFIFLLPLCLSFFGCNNIPEKYPVDVLAGEKKEIYKTINDIPLPRGYTHIKTGDSLYAEWLLGIGLRINKTVYLYNGKPKPNQEVQFAVLDMDIGRKNLLQCADAAIRLRAAYLFRAGCFNKINFIATSGDTLSFTRWQRGIRWKLQAGKLVKFDSHEKLSPPEKSFQAFMEFVYAYCGTYSLGRHLAAVSIPALIQPGDIFIEGGFPGHAVTVMAVATNNNGKIIYLLSQGYRPAQDIHLLKNPGNPKLSPWYSLDDIYPVHTPEWKFEDGSLKRWEF